MKPLDKFKGNGIGNSEERRDIEVRSNPDLDRVIGIYRYCSRSNHWDRDSLERGLIEILTPEDISIFTSIFTSEVEKENDLSNHFIERLILNSYEKGYDNFNIRLKRVNFNFPQNKLFINFEGDMSYICGSNINARIAGDIRGIPGEHDYLRKSNLTICGNAYELMRGAIDCSIKIEGLARNIGEARNCEFYLNKITEFKERFLYCTFITQKEDTFAELSALLQRTRNTVRLVNDQGEILDSVGR